MANLLLFAIVSLLLCSVGCAVYLDDLDCTLPACVDFYYGLKHYSRYDDYEDACYDTVYALQAIPREHGKCLNKRTGEHNPSCIRALAVTIHNCLDRLRDLPASEARFYCGYTLMKHCAAYIGVEGVPLQIPQ